MLKLKVGDIVNIYHNELEREILYIIIKEDGSLKGARYPYRMAQDGNIDWLKDHGEKVESIKGE